MNAPSPQSYQRFFAELKRRQVFRVMGVYSASAFVVIQAADVIFPSIPLPPWTVSLVVWLCLLGFPIAVALAWVFERTPEGIRRTEADEAEIRQLVAQPVSRRWPAGVLALVAVGLLASGGWWAVRGPLAGNASYGSIGVLPFVDLSGAAGDGYFGDGLAEELLNALAGIEGLKVAARTSSFGFRGAEIDIRDIGDSLNVATVLEGSIRRSEDSLRITAQLIDARTGYHLWSGEFDRPAGDIFAVQDEIAGSIVDALAVRLGGDTPESLFRGGTEDPIAYDLYLEGRQLWFTRDVPKLRIALEKFDAAIVRDSSFALAWSGRADVLDAIAWRVPEDRHLVSAAKYAALRSLVLEPDLAEGWASLGVLASDFDRDWRLAELAHRRAIALRPSYSTVYHWLGDVYRYSGRVRKSMEPSRRATELDPLSSLGRDGLAWSLALLGRSSEARAIYEGMVDGAGVAFFDAGVILITQAIQFGLSADEAEYYAREIFRQKGWDRSERGGVIGRALFDPQLRKEALSIVAEYAADGRNLRQLASIAAALGDGETAINYLLEARETGWPMNPAGVDPALEPIRDDPRIIRLFADLGLPNGYDVAADTLP